MTDQHDPSMARPLATAAKILALGPLLFICIVVGMWINAGTMNGLLAALIAAPASAALGLAMGIASQIRKEPGGAKVAIVINALWLLAMGGLLVLVVLYPPSFK